MPSSSFSLQKKLSATSSSSSAVSSPASSSVSALKQDSGGGEQSPRRLTRQRKLRHISNQDLGFYFPEKSRSSPTSPEYSTRQSSSPGRGSKSNQWSCSSAAPQGPQPLPLPEAPVIRRPDSVSRDGFFGPRKNTNQVATTTSAPPNFHSNDRHGMFSLDVNNGGRFNHTLGLNVSSRTAQSNGVSSHPISPRRSNVIDGFPSHIAATTSAVNCSSNCCRGMPQDVSSDYESANVSKSAPTSVFSSPAVSPRKSSPGEAFPSFWAPQDQYQDAFPLRLSPRSPGHSPLHSPTARSPHYQKKSSNETAFLSHRKSFTESPSDRAESNGHVNAHRLPLPPGAMAQPQPSTMHQNTEIVPASSMKGQWQKGKLIGRGTFGSVYLATNRETGALCAMKEVELIPDDPKSAECMKQLEQEIKLLSKLKHPNIVQYYGSDKTDEHFYIYLEYVHPGSINKYVQDHIGAMTESVVRNFTRHILSGLAFLHSMKTIHRDIKGANLLVDASGIVKLADFGMAKHLSGQSYNLSMKGSPYWMAPEVIKAVIQNDADPDLALAVDIWSLGCTIIEMFNGKPPWSDLSGPQAMFKVLNSIPDIPKKLSAEGKDFLDWCFRRNPADRPSASQLLDHPFVRNSHENVTKPNVKQPHFKQTISLMNLMDKLHSPRDHNKPKFGKMLISPRTSN